MLNIEIKVSCFIFIEHGETYGTQNKEFMSDTSANTKLTDYGMNKLKKTAEQINIGI